MSESTPRCALEALLDRWRAGNNHAGEALLRRLYPVVASCLSRAIERDHDDLVQDTMIALLHRLPATRTTGSLESVARGFARIQLLRELRKRGRHRRIVDAVRDELAAVEPAGDRDPESACVQVQVRQALHTLIESLPAAQQSMVRMHYFAEMPLERISRRVGVEVGTVKSRLHRARFSVRSGLGRRAPAPSRGWMRPVGTAAAAGQP